MRTMEDRNDFGVDDDDEAAGLADGVATDVSCAGVPALVDEDNVDDDDVDDDDVDDDDVNAAVLAAKLYMDCRDGYPRGAPVSALFSKTPFSGISISDICTACGWYATVEVAAAAVDPPREVPAVWLMVVALVDCLFVGATAGTYLDGSDSSGGTDNSDGVCV